MGYESLTVGFTPGQRENLREDRSGVTHAISLISFKLPQFTRVNKLFKNLEWFGLPANTRGIRASASNRRGKD